MVGQDIKVEADIECPVSECQMNEKDPCCSRNPEEVAADSRGQ